MRSLLAASLLLIGCVEAKPPSDGSKHSGDAACTAAVWYGDGDGDGYGAADFTTDACEAPARYVANADDCDDTDAAISPVGVEVCNDLDDDCNATVDDDAADASLWYLDGDGDDYGVGTPTAACDRPDGSVADNTDCDDAVGTVHPGAAESCNTVDDDCDGETDEPDAIDVLTWYVDNDGDGYGDPDNATSACTIPAGHTADHDDCDDARADAHIDAPETCNGLDDDCDGTIDDNPTDPTTWYFDADGDGYGTGGKTVSACELPLYYSGESTDCSDTDADVHPDAVEYCDAIDSDCDGVAADDASVDALPWYADTDADGYGDPAAPYIACAAPAGYVADATDCDDVAATVSPGADEVCDTIDDDCDGVVDEDGAVDGTPWYADADADGYGDAAVITLSCGSVTDAVENADDCDDGDADALPGGTEVCGDDIDQDCSGIADDNCGPSGALATADADIIIEGSTAYDYQGLGRTLLATDISGDGAPDLVMANDDYLWIAPGPVTATTSLSDVYSLFDSGILGGALAGGDINGDGVDDLLLTVDATSDSVSLVTGPWLTSDSLSSARELQISLTSPYAIATGELDGDAEREIVATSSSAYIFDGNETGTIDSARATAVVSCASTCSYVTAGDFDGDGIDNLFVESSTIWMFDAMSASMSIAAADATWTSSDGANNRLFAAGDVDGDGLVDLVAASGGAERVRVIVGGTASGALNTVSAALLTGPTGATGFAAYADSADLDGEGHADIAVGAWYGDQVYLFYGPVSGTLSADTDADATITASVDEVRVRFLDVVGTDLLALGLGVTEDTTGGSGSAGPSGAVFLFEGGG